jgi:ankyrin repeat protein
VYRLADRGNLAKLAALLEEHPEVDVDGHKDEVGWSALRCVCSIGYTACAQLLIAHKADAHDMYNNGVSALHSAVTNSRFLGCVKLLVQNRADVNCRASDGQTPLM